jgi:hypothetical protein
MRTASRWPLDVEDTYALQHQEWRIQRLGWTLMAVFLLAGLIGLLGQGWSNRASAESDALSVTFERVLRRHDGSTLTVIVDGRSAASPVELRFNKKFMAGITIDRVVPVPTEVPVPDGVAFRFGSQLDDALMTRIDMSYEATEGGLRRGRIDIDGGDGVSFVQYVLPW